MVTLYNSSAIHYEIDACTESSTNLLELNFIVADVRREMPLLVAAYGGGRRRNEHFHSAVDGRERHK